MINVALPKGRLGEKVYAMFEKAGFECPSIKENNRKLIFENPEKGVRYFWVKPSDVAIYVERGAADIGVAGKDIATAVDDERGRIGSASSWTGIIAHNANSSEGVIAALKGIQSDATGFLCLEGQSRILAQIEQKKIIGIIVMAREVTPLNFNIAADGMGAKVEHHVQSCGNFHFCKVILYYIHLFGIKILCELYTQLAESLNGFLVEIGENISQSFPVADVSGISVAIDYLIVSTYSSHHVHGNLDLNMGVVECFFDNDIRSSLTVDPKLYIIQLIEIKEDTADITSGAVDTAIEEAETEEIVIDLVEVAEDDTPATETAPVIESATLPVESLEKVAEILLGQDDVTLIRRKEYLYR